jgi:hypothetical protein
MINTSIFQEFGYNVPETGRLMSQPGSTLAVQVNRVGKVGGVF